MSTFCAVPGRMTPGLIYPGNPGPVIQGSGGNLPPGPYIPPGGFASDGRPEAPRPYPAGQELATEANANLATEADRV